MLVSSFDPDLIHPASEEKAMASRGVSIWRITDAEPYLERFGHEANTVRGWIWIKASEVQKNVLVFSSKRNRMRRRRVLRFFSLPR